MVCFSSSFDSSRNFLLVFCVTDFCPRYSIDKMSHVPNCLDLHKEDLLKMLACQVHVGTRNLNKEMGRYVYKRRNDGIHLLNINKTWEKIQMAARIIVTIENPADVCVISARPWGTTCCSEVRPLHRSNCHRRSLHSWYFYQSDPEGLH